MLLKLLHDDNSHKFHISSASKSSAHILYPRKLKALSTKRFHYITDVISFANSSRFHHEGKQKRFSTSPTSFTINISLAAGEKTNGNFLKMVNESFSHLFFIQSQHIMIFVFHSIHSLLMKSSELRLNCVLSA